MFFYLQFMFDMISPTVVFRYVESTKDAGSKSVFVAK